MKAKLTPIAPAEFAEGPFKLIGSEWMLITAGSLKNFNMMTASWGGLGHLWNLNVSFVFVRPQRYTFQFMESHEFFTLSFFDDAYHDALVFCGTKSGRDYDKVSSTDLTPASSAHNSVYFQEARLVMECRKLFYTDLNQGVFVDRALDEQVYPNRDHHRMYVGEIVNLLVKS